jgi:hypothetical protein
MNEDASWLSWCNDFRQQVHFALPHWHDSFDKPEGRTGLLAVWHLIIAYWPGGGEGRRLAQGNAKSN